MIKPSTVSREHLPPVVTLDEKLRREELVLSIIPRGNFERVLHLGCADGSLTVRLPGQTVLGLDFDTDSVESIERPGNDRVAFITSKEAFGAVDRVEAFDLALVSGPLAPSLLGSGFPLAWEALQSCIRPGGFVIYDREAIPQRPTLPTRRLDRLLYAQGDRINIMELYCL